MPTCSARGVTATLFASSYRESLSDVVALDPSRRRETQSEEVDRLNAALTNGHALPERVVGDNNIIFDGANSYAPLLIVKTGESVAHSLTDVLGFSSWGNLTSTGIAEHAVFNRLGPWYSFFQSTMPSQSATPTEGPRQDSSDPQALLLAVEISGLSFSNTSGSNGRPVRIGDLKIEVFLNGQLVDVSYVSSRNYHMMTGVISGGFEKHMYHGIRIHQATEKPWIYKKHCEDTALTADEAQKRYQAIGDALKQEADRRGKDANGVCPPSAEFLCALGGVGSVPGVSAAPGIIDVVITSGHGKKDSPAHGHLAKPERMSDPRYTDDRSITDSTTRPGLEEMRTPELPGMGTPNCSLADPFSLSSANGTHPETPRCQVKKFDLNAIRATSSGKRRIHSDSAKCKRRKQAKSGRTVVARLADINKMTVERQEKALAELEGDVDKETLEVIKRNSVDVDTPAKKPKRVQSASMTQGMSSSITMPIRGDHVEASKGVAPVARMLDFQAESSAPCPAPVTSGRYSEDGSVDTGFHMDLNTGMALNYDSAKLGNMGSTTTDEAMNSEGVATRMNGPGTWATFLAQLEDQAASSLAASLEMTVDPAFLPKSYLRMTDGGPATEDCQHTPRSTARDEGDSSVVEVTPSSGSPLKRSRRGGSKRDAALRLGGGGPPAGSGGKKARREAVVAALEAFEEPALCKGSKVGYGEGTTHRMMSKARGGHFEEDMVLVGMRFYVD